MAEDRTLYQPTEEELAAIEMERARHAEANRLDVHSLRSADGHYRDSSGNPVPGLPEPPEGHLWTVGDIDAMASGRAPRYPDPQAPIVLVNPAHDIDLGRKPSNVDPAGINHFARRLPDETRICGGCNQDWPCAGIQGLDQQAAEANASLPQGAALDAAARILGIDKADLVVKLQG